MKLCDNVTLQNYKEDMKEQDVNANKINTKANTSKLVPQNRITLPSFQEQKIPKYPVKNKEKSENSNISYRYTNYNKIK